jgi:YD repeat-containing protein
VAWSGACAEENVRLGHEDDRVLGAAVAPPLGAVPECEVLVEHHAVALSWVWRWSWDAASRTLRTQDGSWTLRYDELGRLVDDVRATDGFRGQYAYDAVQGGLSARRVYRHESLDQTTSFDQHVTKLLNIRAVELHGLSFDGRLRSEQVEYNDAGLVNRFVENGFLTKVSYTSAGQLERAERPNGSSVSCTYEADGSLKTCMEDGAFDLTRPQWGSARDGAPDVTWRFSPGCRAIQELGSAAWFSLPTVAPLPACFRGVPSWRSPAGRCGAYTVSWVSNVPGLVSGRRTTSAQSEPIQCTQSPCLASAGDQFSLRTNDGRPAHFACKEEGRSGRSEEGPSAALELGPIANNWNCTVTREQPSTFEITWKTTRPERVLGATANDQPPSSIQDWLDILFPQRCWRSPCLVARGKIFVLGTLNEPAHVRCVERQTGVDREGDKGWIRIDSVQGDWDCGVTFDSPTPTYTVRWSSDLPSRVLGFQRLFDHPGVEGVPPWERCATSPCEVTDSGDFLFNVIGKRSPRFYCEPRDTDRELVDTDLEPVDRPRLALVLPSVREEWKCSVTFGQLPAHTVTWHVVEGRGSVTSWVRDLGLKDWQPCTESSCLIRDGDEFELHASPSASFECRPAGEGLQEKKREGYGPVFNLGSVERNWECDVKFYVPPPPPPPPPPLRPPHTVTWETTTGLLLTVTGSPGSSCDETSCLVPTNGSVRFEALGRNVVFTCREIARWEPPFFANTSGSTGVLPNIQTNWRCWATISEVY